MEHVLEKIERASDKELVEVLAIAKTASIYECFKILGVDLLYVTKFERHEFVEALKEEVLDRIKGRYTI